MVYEEVGGDTLRAENIDRVIKNVALAKMKLMQVFSSSNSKSWSESYYRETSRNLGVVRGVPRLASFPHDNVDWEKNTAYMEKYGLEAEISWEDAVSNNVDVIQRTVARIPAAIARAVDNRIYTVIDDASGTRTIAAAATWNNATRANRIPHEDIGDAIAELTSTDTQNYEPDTLLVSPFDYTYLVTNDYVMDSFDASQPALMKNGVMGRLLGLNVIKSSSVTADQACVLQSKTCGTWKTLMPLTTAKKQDEGKSITIRGWMAGVAYVTDPGAICIITNTQA